MEPRTVVNVEETVVERVRALSGEALEELLKQERKIPRRGICPRGVYRFHSHEEADAWLEKYGRAAVIDDKMIQSR